MARICFHLLLVLGFFSQTRMTTAHFQALFSGVLPGHTCVQGGIGASAELRCPSMASGMVWKRLSPYMSTGKTVLGFTTTPLPDPTRRVIWPAQPGQSTFIVRATTDDQGLYGVVENSTRSYATCVTYLSVATTKDDNCGRKAAHLELIVKNSSTLVQPGGRFELNSTANLNGIPIPDRLISYQYWDISNKNEKARLIMDEAGHVSGAETSRLHLTNVRCSLTDILILASTNKASSNVVVHITFDGPTQQTIEPKIPSVVRKTAGEQLSLTVKFRSISCQQQQLKTMWMHNLKELVAFSTNKLFEVTNKTLTERRGLVTSSFHQDNGLLTSSLNIDSVQLADSGKYTVEAEIGGESWTISRTKLIVSEEATPTAMTSTLTVQGSDVHLRLQSPSVDDKKQIATGPPTPRKLNNRILLGVLMLLVTIIAIIIFCGICFLCLARMKKKKKKNHSKIPTESSSMFSPTLRYHQLKFSGALTSEDPLLDKIIEECAFHGDEILSFANHLLQGSGCKKNGKTFLSSLDNQTYASPTAKAQALVKYWIDAVPHHRYGPELRGALMEMERGSVVGRYQTYLNGSAPGQYEPNRSYEQNCQVWTEPPERAEPPTGTEQPIRTEPLIQEEEPIQADTTAQPELTMQTEFERAWYKEQAQHTEAETNREPWPSVPTFQTTNTLATFARLKKNGFVMRRSILKSV